MTPPDAELRREVCEELADDALLDTIAFGVSVHDRIVTLVGKVGSWDMKLAAATAAHRVPGVLDVVNELIVCLPHVLRADIELAAAIRRTLAHCAGAEDQIASTVFDGFVVLEGEVDSYETRQAAAAAVRAIAGVVAVDDRITLRSPERRETPAS